MIGTFRQDPAHTLLMTFKAQYAVAEHLVTIPHMLLQGHRELPAMKLSTRPHYPPQPSDCLAGGLQLRNSL
jgi:hypothetical protein